MNNSFVFISHIYVCHGMGNWRNNSDEFVCAVICVNLFMLVSCFMLPVYKYDHENYSSYLCFLKLNVLGEFNY